MDEKRFEIIYKQGVSLSTEVRILRDKVTGVHYLINWTGQGGGVTPLLNAEGKPVVSFD